MTDYIQCTLCATAGIIMHNCQAHKGMDFATTLSDFEATLNSELLLAWGLRDRATRGDGSVNDALFEAFQNFVDARTNLKQVRALQEDVARENTKARETRDAVEAIAESLYEMFDTENVPGAVFELAKLFDISLTEQRTYVLTILANVTVDVPRGAEHPHTWNFTTSGLHIEHDEYEVDDWDYEVHEVEEA